MPVAVYGGTLWRLRIKGATATDLTVATRGAVANPLAPADDADLLRESGPIGRR